MKELCQHRQTIVCYTYTQYMPTPYTLRGSFDDADASFLELSLNHGLTKSIDLLAKLLSTLCSPTISYDWLKLGIRLLSLQCKATLLPHSHSRALILCRLPLQRRTKHALAAMKQQMGLDAMHWLFTYFLHHPPGTQQHLYQGETRLYEAQQAYCKVLVYLSTQCAVRI